MLFRSEENFVNAFSKILDREVLLEQELVKTFLQGREIKPYSTRPSGKIVIIPYVIQNGRGKLINEKEMGESYKHTYAYFTENRSYLENRERGKMKGDNWYGFVYPKNIDILGIEKILVPDIADKASFAFDASGDYAFTVVMPLH